MARWKNLSYKKRGYSSKKRKTKCYCPMCETYHYLNINWRGNGIPRMYCNRCKSDTDLDPSKSIVLEQHEVHITLDQQPT